MILKKKDILEKIRHHFKRIVQGLSKEQIGNICSDILSHMHVVHSIISNAKFLEMYKNVDGSPESYLDFKKRLMGVLNLAVWQVDISDGFGSLTFEQQLELISEKAFIVSVIIPNINQNALSVKQFMDSNGFELLYCFEDEEYDNSNLSNTKMTVMCFSSK